MTKKTPFIAFSALLILAISLQFNAKSVSAQAVGGGGGGGGGSAPICLDKPVQINLKENLKVESISGQPQVTLDWTLENTKDANQEQKIEAFMSYLNTNPTLGVSKNKLKNAFAEAVYSQLAASENPLVKNKWDEVLAENIQNTQLLEDKNIDRLFADYYAYIFVDQLHKDADLSAAVLSGMKRGLTGDTIQPSSLVKNVASTLKNIQTAGPLKDTATCMAKRIGSSTVEQFNPSHPQQVYGSQGNKMLTIITVLKEQGKVQPILEAIKQDKDLMAQTKLALKAGMNPVLDVWANNSNVQNLIRLYETDPEMKKLRDTFFETNLGKKLDDCIKSNYSDSLLDLAKESYLPLIHQKLASSQAYSDEATAAVLQALNKILGDSSSEEVKAEASRITQNFINDYLLLEQEVSKATHTGVPFADYYRGKLSNLADYVDGMTVELQRDGETIQSFTNPSISHYVDRTVPLNTSGKVVYHQYNLVGRTQCDQKTGNSVQAAINPTLPDNTAVQAFTDIKIRLKDNQTNFLMERLKVLLQTLQEGKTQLTPSTNPSQLGDAKACDASRTALLQSKTSDKLFSYVLDCFGDGQINEALQDQMEGIVNPLIRFLELNQFTDTDKITEVFLTPIIELAREEYKTRMEILAKVSPLAQAAPSLLKVENLDEFTQEQRQLIKCGGQDNCPEEVQKLMEKYLGGGHAANLSIEIYNEAGILIRSKSARTDIFGQIDQVALGDLKAGQNYQFKVKLADQPYALAKISQITISEATPLAAGKFKAQIELQSETPFFYGNFDNSNDVIDLKDIEAWSTLVTEDPKKWSDYNVDGLTGVDLFDATQIQNHWGTQKEEQEKNTELTLSQLAKLFGYRGGDATLVYTPKWLLKLN